MSILTGDLFTVDLSVGSEPTIVEAVRGEHVLELSGGYAKTSILTGTGIARTVAPGSAEAEPAADLSGLEGQLAQVAFGSKHSAAVTHGGQVYTFGDGALGQLGHGNCSRVDQPHLLGVLAERAVAQVACGKSHTLALTAQGDVYTWGACDEGQLGLGRNQPSFVPRYLSALQGTPIALVATGAAHAAVLSVYGRVYTWGEAICGQLGLGRPLSNQSSPIEVPGLPDVKALACGECHTAVLSADGALYSWGLSTRGPPLSHKTTPSPELVELAEPIESLACGGGSTLVVTESGAALCWPGAGREMATVPLAQGVRASRVACGGTAALVFAETCLTSVVPTCSPLKGGSQLTLRGGGFFESDGVVLRFTHATGEVKLVRGRISHLASGEIIVTAESPRFDRSAEGLVYLAVSFEEGVGETFTTSEIAVRYYKDPSVTVAMPCCAPAAIPTELRLKAGIATGGAGGLFDSPDALAMFYAADGPLLASVPATFDADADEMIVKTPTLEGEASTLPGGCVRIALDGQTPAKDGHAFRFYAPLVVETLTPRCGPASGGTKLVIKGSPFFSTPHVALKCTVLEPPVPPPAAAPPAAAPAAAPAGAEEVEAAPPEVSPPEGEEGGAEGGAEEVEELPPALPELEVGHSFMVEGAYDSVRGNYVFVSPKLGATGLLDMQLTADGINFVTLPSSYVVHPPLKVQGVSPAVGSMSGGATIKVKAARLVDSAEASVVFVKGSTRIELPATLDADGLTLNCTVPAWPPAAEIVQKAEAATAAAVAATEEGAEPPEAPPIELGELGSDSIVEISLNGQQWTTDCNHFAFVLDPIVQAADPPAGPIEGGAPIKVSGLYIGDGDLKARFIKLPAIEEGEKHSLPADGTAEAMEVGAVGAAGAADLSTPAFEGAAEPFDAALQLSADGQVYGPSFAVFRYEAVAAKGKKK